MSFGVILVYIFGAALRYSLLSSPLQSIIASRVEVSTPVNAWMRVKEGVFLHSQGVAVYSGGVYHGSPYELYFARLLFTYFENYIPIIFILCDLLTAYLLSHISSSYSKMLLKLQSMESSKYSSDATPLLLKSSELKSSVNYVAIAYLFCPYTIASCVGQTSTVFANLVLAMSLLAMLRKWQFTFGALIALSTYQSLYPICLLVPGILASPGKSGTIKILSSFVVASTLLLVSSSKISGGWQFLEATYGFILAAPDLTPNIGLFWYFFTEMFEHFRLFFLATFQINIFVYVAPLSVKLRHDPMLLSMSFLALMSVFRSYPSLGDVGFYLCLLPLWCHHLDPYLRQIFLVGCMLFATSILGPIMYNLWIFNGSANANFYFAITLVFNTAQIFLVTDLLFAHKKRRYHLFNGSVKDIEGTPADLSLE